MLVGVGDPSIESLFPGTQHWESWLCEVPIPFADEVLEVLNHIELLADQIVQGQLKVTPQTVEGL